MTTTMEKLEFRWHTFDELTGKELYALLRLRQEVFVVEQRCAYQDCDDLDQRSWHLAGWGKRGEKAEPAAYLRVILPASSSEMPVIGRVVLRADRRGQGEGKNLLTLALRRIEEVYPLVATRISAQHHLLKFYQDFGFTPVSGVYDEDGIPHVAMVRPPQIKELRL